MVKRYPRCHIPALGAFFCAGVVILSFSTLSQAANTIRANTVPHAEKDNLSVGPSQNSGTSEKSNAVSIAAAAKTADLSTPDTLPTDDRFTSGSLEEQSIGKRPPGARQLRQTNSKAFAGPSLWQTAGSLLIVLALIIAAAYLFRRYLLGSQRKFIPSGMEIIARNNINPKQSLCLVKLGGRLILLGLSPNHMALLHTIDDPEEVAQLIGRLQENKPGSITNSFGKLFHRESDIYQDDVSPAEQDNYRNGKNPSWHQARGELSALLDKVKGLSRIRFRS